MDVDEAPVDNDGASTPPPVRRAPMALVTWAFMVLVLVIVVVLLVLKITQGSTTIHPPPVAPAAAGVVQAATSVPLSVFDAVGAPNSAEPGPALLSGQPALTVAGRPAVVFVGGEFCPYCAAERWALVASMSRFGKFTGLRTMQSSSSDSYANTQTFTFADATFTSPYITLQMREVYSNQPNSADTGYTTLQSLNKTQSALVSKYDTGKYTGSSTPRSGSIPFIDFGNKALVSGASYTPAILQGLSRSDIAAGLSDPKDPATQAIVATSNYLSAAVCTTDGGKPASVCASKGVTAATKALGLAR